MCTYCTVRAYNVYLLYCEGIQCVLTVLCKVYNVYLLYCVRVCNAYLLYCKGMQCVPTVLMVYNVYLL